MRQEFSKTALTSNKVIQRVYDKWYQEYYRFQIQYEHDTRFGTELNAQARFDSLVTEALHEAEKWK